jgi:hypothetical protein
VFHPSSFILRPSAFGTEVPVSAIIILPVVIPAAAAAWPLIAAAAAAAASALGYAATGSAQQAAGATEVELALENCEAVTQGLALGESLSFAKDDVTVTFFRDTRGRVAVKVAGRGRSPAELKAIGQKLAQGLTQQYAYHRLVTELKSRNFNVVDEQVEEDGTVRLQVRTYQG